MTPAHGVGPDWDEANAPGSDLFNGSWGQSQKFDSGVSFESKRGQTPYLAMVFMTGPTVGTLPCKFGLGFHRPQRLFGLTGDKMAQIQLTVGLKTSPLGGVDLTPPAQRRLSNGAGHFLRTSNIQGRGCCDGMQEDIY